MIFAVKVGGLGVGGGGEGWIGLDVDRGWVCGETLGRVSRTRGGLRWGASRDEVSAPGERREYGRQDIQGVSSATSRAIDAVSPPGRGGRKGVDRFRESLGISSC